ARTAVGASRCAWGSDNRLEVSAPVGVTHSGPRSRGLRMPSALTAWLLFRTQPLPRFCPATRIGERSGAVFRPQGGFHETFLDRWNSPRGRGCAPRCGGARASGGAREQLGADDRGPALRRQDANRQQRRLAEQPVQLQLPVGAL